MELHKLKDISEPLAELNCRSGLMFYKLLSEVQTEFDQANETAKNEINRYDIADYQEASLKHHCFFIDKCDLFSAWIFKGNDFHVSDVMDACNALSRCSIPEFKKDASYIVDTFHTSLTKLGESTQIQTRVLSSALYSIDELELLNIEDVKDELKIMLDNQGSQSQPSPTF
jgi:type I restriction enzyme M protein